MAEARRARQRTSLAIFAGGFLGLLGGILAALLFTTRIGNRVRHLEAEARDVAAGRTLTHEVHGDDEIAQLERTLQETSELLTSRAQELRNAHEELEARVDQRTAELREANEELRASNEVRQALVQSSPLAIWAVDLEGKVTFWNPAAERIFGWTEAEVIGRPLPVVREEDLEDYRRVASAVRRKARRFPASSASAAAKTAR